MMMIIPGKNECVKIRKRNVTGMSSSDKHLEILINICTAKGIWNTILNIFECHTLLKKLAGRGKVYTVLRAAGGNVLHYINRVKQLVGTLKSMDWNTNDLEIAMAV